MIKTLELEKLIGKRVRVYRNLHNGLLSVQIKTSNGWRVVGHVSEIALSEVEFKVYESGRDRVVAEGRKNVHAFVVGTVVSSGEVVGEPVSYNPYLMGSFYDKHTKQAIARSNRCQVSPLGIIAE